MKMNNGSGFCIGQVEGLLLLDPYVYNPSSVIFHYSNKKVGRSRVIIGMATIK